MNEEEKYFGHRAGEQASEEPTDYQPRRVSEEDPEVALASEVSEDYYYTTTDGYTPSHVEDDEEGMENNEFLTEEDKYLAELNNEGTAFDVAKGKRQAFIESVYSSEIDGGVMETSSKKSRKGFYAIMTITLALLAGVLATIFIVVNSNDNGTVNLQPGQAPTITTVENKLPDLYPDTKGTNRHIEVSNTPTSFSGGAVTLSSAELEMLPASTDCTIDKALEFCYAGNAAYEGGGFRVFFGGDLINSKVFHTMYEFEEIERTATTLTAQAVVDFAGHQTRFLLYTNSTNAQGFFIELPLDATPEQAVLVSKDFQYEVN